MSADKRSVSTDALETLGTLIDEHQKRDAIHLAVLPAEAGMRLHAGQDVALVDGKAVTGAGKAVGIVDPFLKTRVEIGERFWLVIYPRVITSLRHVWSHPDLEDETGARPEPVAEPVGTAAAMATLSSFAESAGLSVQGMIEAARDYKERGNWVTLGHSSFDGVGDEFWSAYDIVTGESTPPDQRENFFSCSC